jgi:hypothetical protein
MPIPERSMKKLAASCRRIDELCARLNHGLAAVAIVLAITTVVISCVRHPEGLQIWADGAPDVLEPSF